MAITYEQIQAANATIKTTPIHGKNYAEVPQRIKAFRMLYPQGFIRTELVSVERPTGKEGICTFRAVVGYYTESGNEVVLSTGMAQEKENSSNINRTSYIENCETSAVGRALGIAGFGIDTSVASYEEVANAILNQGGQPQEVQQEAAPVYCCEDCGVVFRNMRIKGEDGKAKEYTAKEVYELSKQRNADGKARCAACRKKFEEGEDI